MLLDQQSGFGAVAEELLHAIGDDFGRLPTLLFSLAPAAAPPRPSGQVRAALHCLGAVRKSVCCEQLCGGAALTAAAMCFGWQDRC